MKILEVIVSSLADAIEAEAGGADRLELVRDLDAGGLTPDLSLAAEICSAVSLPVRVMVRESGSMTVANDLELRQLCRHAEAFSRLRIDGVVLGFVRDERIDTASLDSVLSAAPGVPATFHRAFDRVSNPIDAICALKCIPQIDRLLTIGGPGSWAQRKLRLHYWQRQARPELKILAGGGVVDEIVADLMADSFIEEVHIGRAARNPPDTSGIVCREKVARLKSLHLSLA